MRLKLTPLLLSVPKRLMSEVMRPERKTLFMVVYLSRVRQRADPVGRTVAEGPERRRRRTGAPPPGNLRFWGGAGQGRPGPNRPAKGGLAPARHGLSVLPARREGRGVGEGV